MKLEFSSSEGAVVAIVFAILIYFYLRGRSQNHSQLEWVGYRGRNYSLPLNYN